MTIAIDPDEDFPFQSEEDLQLPEEQRTTWLIRGLDVRQRTRLEGMGASAKVDQATQAVGAIQFHAGDLSYEAVRAGLKGCDNFRGTPTEEEPEGPLIEFEHDKLLGVLGKNIRPPTDRFLSRIPPNVFDQIGLAVRNGMRLTPDEGKD